MAQGDSLGREAALKAIAGVALTLQVRRQESGDWFVGISFRVASGNLVLVGEEGETVAEAVCLLGAALDVAREAGTRIAFDQHEQRCAENN